MNIGVGAAGGVPWAFGALQPFSYDLVMVDVPTETKMRSPKGEKKTPQAQYGCMSIKQAAALPVGNLIKGTGVLFLWWTWPRLLYGGDIAVRFKDHKASRSEAGELIDAWGARYVTGGSWFKRTKNGLPAFGPGYRVRTTCEPFLLAIFGNPHTREGRRMRNVIESIEENAFDGLRREHSRKPEEAYAWCERYMPGARYAELFSRTSRPRWDTWGLEAGKFDPVVTLNAAPRAEHAA
jgi:N6-adenosine-specific RNA methylase IME4